MDKQSASSSSSSSSSSPDTSSQSTLLLKRLKLLNLQSLLIGHRQPSSAKVPVSGEALVDQRQIAGLLHHRQAATELQLTSAGIPGAKIAPVGEDAVQLLVDGRSADFRYGHWDPRGGRHQRPHRFVILVDEGVLAGGVVHKERFDDWWWWWWW